MKRTLWIAVLAAGTLLALSSCVPVAPTATLPAAPTQPPVVTVAPTAAIVAPTLPPVVTPTAPAATAAPTAAASTAVSTPAAAIAATPAVTGTVAVTGTAAADLPTLRLAALTSYVAQIEIRDEAVSPAAGATPVAPITMTMRYRGVPTPPAYSWTTSGQTGVAGTEELRVVMVGQTMYVFDPTQGKWLQMPSTSPQNLPVKEDMLDPNRLAQTAPAGLFSAPNVVDRHESLDGVDTTHYRANATQMAELLRDAGDANRTPVSGQADFWVANEHSYLKQYILKASLKDQQGQEYTQTITFKLASENQPVDIATPAPDQIISMGQLQAGGTPAPGATP